MSAWIHPKPKPRPKPDPCAGLGFKKTATHIRGRVTRGRALPSGAWSWQHEVVNTVTGRVIVTDDCSDFASILFACQEAVAVARGAWFYSLRPRDVKKSA